jgi:hypothetical protein
MDENLVLFPKGTPHAIRSLLDERDSLRAQLAHQNNAQALANQQLQDKGHSLQQFDPEVEKAIRARLTSLLTSKSWRLSAPLRVLGQLLGDRVISAADCQKLAPSQLDEAMARVRASTSWRITAPLRKIDETLRGVLKLVSQRRS